MDNKPSKIVLFGGNSEIGLSIVKGLIKKYKLKPIDCFFIVRNKAKKELENFNLIRVNKYSDAINMINREIKASEKIIFVISYGILIEEEVSFNISNYRNQIEVNALQQVELFSNLINKKNTYEMHIASSILADFTRPSVYSYSVSKQILSKHIKHFLNTSKSINSKIFEWKFSFVKTNLNKYRNPSLIKTDLKHIENTVSKKNKQGIHYVPAYAQPFVFVAKTFNSVIVLFEKSLKQ